METKYKIITNKQELKKLIQCCKQTGYASVAIGQAKDGTVIMMVVDGRQMHSFGISIERCGEIMEQYGAYQASMLDGGSSSVMVYRGREITSPTTLSQNEEGRYLPDAFLVK